MPNSKRFTHIDTKKKIHPPPLRKHQPGQESDGQTGSWCLDKAVQPRDVRYQKKAYGDGLQIGKSTRSKRV